jgi:nucleotide-binding universal stress UspA family protein
MYDDVLVPTDGSDGTERAVDNAATLVSGGGGRLHVVSVVDTRDRFGGDSAGPTGTAGLASARERAEEAVGRAAGRVDDGLPVVTTVEAGPPVPSLLAYAEREGVDVVVLGSHGRTGLDRFLHGSTAERLVRHATVPVLVVPLATDETIVEETPVTGRRSG